jgi:chemotaxis response regulator CheB
VRPSSDGAMALRAVRKMGGVIIVQVEAISLRVALRGAIILMEAIPA